MKDCLFCKIVSNQIPSDVVYENKSVIGFKDIHPQAPTHLLFIPRKHVSGVHEITTVHDTSLNELVVAANEVAKKLGVDQSGYRLVVNCKDDGGQTVGHLHLHLLAGRRMNWPPG